AFSFIKNLSDRAAVVESNIHTLSSNHFPHMEASLTNQDQLLKSIDTSLKALPTLSAAQDSIRASLQTQDGLLHSIDGSLKTLAGRKRSKRD
ncbi:MAG: hypothetical protein WB555_12545, partial [Candidatus Korobacteraceae bacterium]